MFGSVKTVADAIAPLSKVQSNLAAVVEKRKADCENKRADAKRLEDEALVDQTEADRASKIAARLEELLGV